MKKRGSTLITVICIFAILFTVGTAALSLSLSSLKRREVESKKIENLYSAESGIDEANKIIETVVDTAIKKSNLKVVDTISEINSQIDCVNKQVNIKNSNVPNSTTAQNEIDAIVADTLTDEKIKNLFKINELGTNDSSNIFYFINNSGQVDLNLIQAKQQNVFKKSFKELLNDNLSECFKYDSSTNTYTYYNLILDNNEVRPVQTNLNNDAKISINYTKLNSTDINDTSVSTIPLKLQSTFKSSDGVERQIETQYTITVPDITYKTISNNPLLQKTIVADGDMYITSNFTIDGDIFVQGNTPTNRNVYGKYETGININIDKDERSNSEKLKDHIDVNFNGNVVTSNTLNLKQNSTVKITSGNIYANNINIGKVKYDDKLISNNTLLVEDTDVIVDNDFTFNCTISNVTINNLYAVNEYRQEANNDTPEKSSSSIIINNYMDDGKSSITIKNDAYIIGVAYINVSKKDTSGKEIKYKTGESIAIKGNYSAYTSPINDPSNDYEFNYYAPLQLVDTMIDKEKNQSDMKYTDKAKYFMAASQNGQTLTHSGSIKLLGTPDNLYIKGVYIKDGVAYNDDLETSYKKTNTDNKRREYANQVYEMGSFVGNTNVDDPLMYVYNKMKVNKNVSNLIDISKYNEKNVKVNDTSNIVAIYNSTSGKPILLSDTNGSSVDYLDKINIDQKKGIIISNTDIMIDSDVTFTGTIITTGNIYTADGKTINIKYDGAVIQDLVNKYDLESIFNTSKSITAQLSAIGTGSISAKDFIHNSNWRIKK